MTSLWRERWLPVLFLAFGQVMGGVSLAGQPAGIEPPARPASAITPSIPPLPLPSTKSPVDFFRELLAMPAADRFQALTNRTPENRRLILAKVREYSSLKADERELRLRATELEWRLVPLMRISATNRTPGLAALADEDRKMIEIRLQEWDRLPDSVRKDLLDRRESIRIFIQMTANPTQAPATLTNAPYTPYPQRRLAVEEGLKKLQAMSEAERQQTIARFNQFFDLNPLEKQKALRTLTQPEQDQIARTLRKFGGLTPGQRAQCVQSFEQFAGMTRAEQQQFLKNAERWILMTPEQRNAWRQVVENVSIMPPPSNFIPLPPRGQSPRSQPPRASRPVAATNGN